VGMPLQNQPVLILDACTDGFAADLRSALEAAGAAAAVCSDEIKALAHLSRFEFSAVLDYLPDQRTCACRLGSDRRTLRQRWPKAPLRLTASVPRTRALKYQVLVPLLSTKSLSPSLP
jgi:hypothetical protein